MYLKVGQKNLEPPAPVSLSFSPALAQYECGPLSLPEVRGLRPRLLSVPCILCLQTSEVICHHHGVTRSRLSALEVIPPPPQTLATPDPMADLRASPLCWCRTTGVMQSRGVPTGVSRSAVRIRCSRPARLPSWALLVTQCSYPTVCTDHSPFTHSPAGGHRGCLRLWGIMSPFLIVVKST